MRSNTPFVSRKGGWKYGLLREGPQMARNCKETRVPLPKGSLKKRDAGDPHRRMVTMSRRDIDNE